MIEEVASGELVEGVPRSGDAETRFACHARRVPPPFARFDAHHQHLQLIKRSHVRRDEGDDVRGKCVHSLGADRASREEASDAKNAQGPTAGLTDQTNTLPSECRTMLANWFGPAFGKPWFGVPVRKVDHVSDLSPRDVNAVEQLRELAGRRLRIGDSHVSP